MQLSNSSQKRGEKLWNRHFILAALLTLFIGLGMSMMNSTMAKYVYSLYGNASFSGYLNAAFAAAAVIARLIGGNISDRHGRRRVIMFGAFLFAVSVFFFGIFPYAALLIIFRGLQGFGYAVATTANNASGADVLPEERMSEGIGYLGLGYSLATAIGPSIALALIFGTDYSWVFYVTTAVIMLAVVGSFFIRYEKLPFYQQKIAEQKQRSAAVELSEYKGIARFIERKAVPATIVQFFSCMSWAAINSFVVLFADSRGFTNASSFFIATAVAMCLTRFFAGRLSDKFGVRSVAVPALLLNVVTFTLLIFVSSQLMFLFLGFMAGLVNGTLNPVMQAASIKNSPVNRRGAASGTYQLSNDIANGLGAVLWGLVIDASGFSAAFVGCIICTVLAFVSLAYFFGKKNRQATF